MNFKLYLPLFVFVIFTTQIKAQFNFYAGYQGIYDDNIFNNYLMVDDFINSLSFGSAINFESELNNLQIYYEGNVNAFRKNPAKNFNAHRIGIVETHLFSIDDNPLNAGINYSFRNNKDEFEIYDFSQFSAYINYRHSISQTDFIVPGYVFNKNDYKNFSLFSHSEHKLFLNWVSSFETRTSILLNLEYNLKSYKEKYSYENYLNNASLIKFMANVSQSVDEKTGVNVFGAYRTNLSDGSRYLLSDSLIYYEEEIFNDIYSYDGFETGFGFKHFLGDKIGLSLEAKYVYKKFSSLNVVDIDGNELNDLRIDKLWGLGANLDFDLSGITDGLTLSASWNYIKNNSNDYFYKYSNQIISASLDFEL